MAGEKILIADDDKSIRKTVALVLEAEGYAVDKAATGDEAKARLDENTYDILLLDLRLPDCDGLEILEHAGTKSHMPVAIMITAFGTIESAVDAVKAGAFHYVSKPIDMDNLKLLIRQGLDRHALLRENVQLKQNLQDRASFSGIIGASKAMQDVFEMVRLTAVSHSSVLILGETGTGKELVADALHYNSERRDRPFVKINCAALPETLLESELFGHEKGAFTDAREQKKGVFELAHGGTILFDEIGCMSLGTQAKLLRVLQDGKVRRLGGEKDFQVDVRVIASTNEQVEQAIENKTFRNDLYFRLNVVQIKLPPLREHKEDVTLLAGHFIQRYGKGSESIAPDAMEILLEHDWPGNVRELENVIQRAFIFEIKGVIEKKHLPPELAGKKNEAKLEIPDSGMTFDDFTLELIKQTLEKTGGNKSRAAEILGVSRNFIRRHLQEK